MINLDLYSVCFKDHLSKFEQYNQHHLMCGAYNLNEDYKKSLINYKFDDTCDNISNLNKWFGDLTGLYWVWKNTNHEFVGVNQYRRKWLLNITDIDKKTLYISHYINFTEQTIKQQFEMCHGSQSTEVFENYIKNKNIFNDSNIFNKLTILSPFNMFFAHRDVFNKTCEILFSIIFDLYNELKNELPYIQVRNQTRLIAFLSERILTMLYEDCEYFKNINIKQIYVKTINNNEK